jgi:lipoprotein-releasing system ATP-binding protein
MAKLQQKGAEQIGHLNVSNLSKTYPTVGGDLVIFEGLSLQLSRGENVAVTGPSGTGKSTLLHILGALDNPTTGSVELAGENPFAMTKIEQAAFRRKHIGFVFQDHQLLPTLNVLENTLVPALAEGTPKKQDLERAKELLEKVGMAHRLDHLPNALSGGERARVAVARALLLKPTLVLADEPTGNLDPSNARKIAGLLLDLQVLENNLLVVVTHSMEVADRLQRRVELNRNRDRLESPQ